MGFKPETFKWLPLMIILFGIGNVFVAIILSVGGFHFMLKMAVKFQTRLVEGSNTYNQWKDIPIFPLMKVRFFNVTNPEELSYGMKAKLQEVGPYVYREHLYKKEISYNEDTDTFTYHLYHDYQFQPALSSGKESDVLTMINLPFVAIAKLAHEFTDVDYLLATLDEMIQKKGERLTRRETVRDILFDGISVQTFLDLANDPIVKGSGQAPEIPPQLANGRIGILEGRNGTHQGWEEVKSGVKDSEEFGKYISHDGKHGMSVWRGRTCNAINGTDGMIYPPFLHNKESLDIFLPETCRTLTFHYTKPVTWDLVPTRRYQLTEKIFQSPLVNPDNWCFCPSENLTTCDVDGFINVGPCFGGAPLYISHPHFLFMEGRIPNMVIGLDPDPEKHWGFMDLNPTTGVTLVAKHRLMFSIHVQEYLSMPTFQNISEMYLPILWVEEGAALIGLNKMLLQALSIIEVLWPLAVFGQMFNGVILCPGIAYIILKRRQGRNDSIVKSAKSTDSDYD